MEEVGACGGGHAKVLRGVRRRSSWGVRAASQFREMAETEVEVVRACSSLFSKITKKSDCSVTQSTLQR